MTDEDIFPPEAIQRDHYGRPLIIVDGQPALVPYTRCSTYAKALSDTGGLTKWKLRQVMIGVSLGSGGATDITDNAALDAAIEAAYERAGANESARKGTAIHGLTEWVDGGVEFDRTDPAWGPYMPFVATYERLMEHAEILDIEQFVVHDDLKVAGTYDRLVKVPGHGVIIGDIKTGTGAAKNPHEAAIQMAMYARSRRYDPHTGARSAIHEDINTGVGLLIHVPSNGARAGTYLLDLDAAWEAAKLADDVRRWRNASILTPYQIPPF